MMRISSLTLIPIMFFGILLFSSPTFSQDRSDQTPITRSDYISMDKQVSILEFRVKELEKNSDKIDALKSDILSNKANLHFLNILSTGVYALIFAIVALTSYFTFTRTKEQTAEQCKEWFKNNREEIIETVEKQASTWLTDNKNEVIQHIKDRLSTAFLESLDQKDGKELIRQVIRDEISQISSDPITSKDAVSQNNRQHLQQDSIASENLIIEDSMPSPQGNFNSATTDKNSEEQEAAKLFKTAINSRGIEKISAYSKLIDQFKDSKNEEILIRVAKTYFNLGNNLEGQDKIDTYRELIKQFKDSKNEEILIPVTRAYFNLGNSLEGQDKIDTYRELIKQFRELIKQFKDSKNEEILIPVTRAYLNLGNNLEGQDKIDTYRELIEQFKDSENKEILIRVAKAYVNLANKLINTNQRNEAIPLLSEAIKQFKESDNQEIKLQLAKMEFLYNSLLQNS